MMIGLHYKLLTNKVSHPPRMFDISITIISLADVRLTQGGTKSRGTFPQISGCLRVLPQTI